MREYYLNEVVPYAISIGISYSEFWSMNPKILNVYSKADLIKRMNVDTNNWYLGQYFSAAIGVCFSKNAKYPKKPFLRDIYEDMNLTQEERDEKALREMIRNEELWILNDKARNLPKLDGFT